MPAGVAWYFAPAILIDCLRAAALHVWLQYRWPRSQSVHRKNICRHIGRGQVRKRRLSSTAHVERQLLATCRVPLYVSPYRERATHTGTPRQMGSSVPAGGPFVFLGEPFVSQA